MSLSKSQILKAQDRAKLEKVPVPEWGGDVYLRILSGTERDQFEDETYKVRGKTVELNRTNIRARLLAICLCDEKGARLFTDADAAALGEKASPVITRLFDLAQKINGLTKADVEDLAKNSGAGQAGDSTSDSPPISA